MHVESIANCCFNHEHVVAMLQCVYGVKVYCVAMVGSCGSSAANIATIA